MKFKTYDDDKPLGIINVPDSLLYTIAVAPYANDTLRRVVRLRVFEGTTEITRYISPSFATEAEAHAALALVEGGHERWVDGPPPIDADGKWFLARLRGVLPVAAHCLAGPGGWKDAAGNLYHPHDLSHHVPTPICPVEAS